MKIDCLWGFIPINVFKELPNIINKYEINTPNRLAHYLGQLKVESNFVSPREKLNYSAKRILEVYGKKIKTLKEAKQYAHNPEALGNKIFSGGYKYRGRGYIQLTHDYNYQSFGEFIGVDLLNNPDLVASKYPLESSAWYFKYRVGKAQDEPLTDLGIKIVTSRINPKLMHLKQRIYQSKKFYKIINCQYDKPPDYKDNYTPYKRLEFS